MSRTPADFDDDAFTRAVDRLKAQVLAERLDYPDPVTRAAAAAILRNAVPSINRERRAA